MKVKSYLTSTLFAWKEIPVDSFLRETEEFSFRLFKLESDTEMLLILPSESNKKKVHRMFGLVKSQTPARVLSFINSLRLPKWKE